MSDLDPRLAGTRLDDDDDDEEEGLDLKEKGLTAALVKHLLRSRTILISEPISDKIARAVMAQAIVLESLDAAAPITVYINSPGGSADSGFAIYDFLRYVKPPVRTVCAGLCASAAVIIQLAAPEGQRFTLPNSRFLIHQPSTAFRGDASDIHITAQQIVKLKDRYNAIVAEATGKSAKKIAEDADRDFWLSAEESVKYGLIDKVIQERGELD